MKRVLFIAYYFPPRNQVASYRPGCFAKYLPENGWLPTVICEEFSRDRPNQDPHFVGTIPSEVEIIPFPSLGPYTPFRRFFYRKLFPYWRPYHAPYVWWRAATAAVRDAAQRTQFDAVWATSDPIVTLGLAQESATHLGLPWMADLRDSFNVQRLQKWYRRPIWAFHERRLCRQASAVVTVSRHMAKTLALAVGQPVEVLENGFDPELFPPPPPLRRDVFRLIYAGTFHSQQQNPRPVLEALQSLFENRAVPANKIELAFYEPSSEQLNEVFPGVTQALPVRAYPRLSHKDIITVQQTSAALLLLTVTGLKGVLTGKLFDYLAAGRPILAVPDDDGDVAALLRETGAGVTANSPQEIARLLKTWYDQWDKIGDIPMQRHEPNIARYSRRTQTRRLAEMLEALTQGRESGAEAQSSKSHAAPRPLKS